MSATPPGGGSSFSPPPSGQPPLPERRRWPTHYRAWLAVGTAVLAAAGVAGWRVTSEGAPTEPGVASYLCYNGAPGGSALLLQWKDNGGVLSGTYQAVEVTGTAPSEQASPKSGNITGQISAQSITVDLDGRGQVYGKLTPKTLTLNVPQSDGTIQPVSCTQASIATWNNTVSQLDRKASLDNAAANAQALQEQQDQQTQQAQQALSNDVAQLAQDAAALDTDKSLAGEVQQMSQALAQEQADWSTAQGESCPDLGGQVATVGGDAATVSGDLDSLNGNIQSLQAGEIATVQHDLSAVQSDLSTLQSLGATPATNSAAAVAAGNKALSDSTSAMSWANQQGASLNGQAQQIATEAQNYANNAGC